MTEKNKPLIEIDMSRYDELEQYMPRQVVLAQSQERKASETNSEIPTSMKGMEVYESLIASVRTSSMAIRELARVKQELMHQNQELQSQYEQQLSELRELLANEQSRAAALEIEMKTLKGGYQHRLEEVSSRNQQLESHNADLSGQFEKQSDELKKVRGILDYLVGEVSESLKEALNELNFTS